MVALALSHLENEIMPFEFEVVRDIEIEFAGRDWHHWYAIVRGEVGLNWVPGLIEPMMTSYMV